MFRKLTSWIMLGMVLGCLAGAAIHALAPSREVLEAAVGGLSVVTDIFLRLIKMIIAPLVLSTLIVGISQLGGGADIGRIGVKTLGWFLTATMCSLLIGAAMANLLQIGSQITLPLPDAATAEMADSTLSLRTFITHLVPASPVDAMARNEILQIVVFSVFAGVAVAALGERISIVRTILVEIAEIMLRITSYVMMLSPIAVFAAIAATIAAHGLGILVTYAAFVGGFYLSLSLVWVLIVGAGFAIVGPAIVRLLGRIRAPMLLAFSTASSEAAYPRTLHALETFGIPNRIASFVLPLGYSLNLDGTAMYTTFAVLFIAQCYGIQLSVTDQALLLLLLMVTSKGLAGVPRGSLVVIASALTVFDIPVAGMLLILGVDHFLDMGRSATNVVGNSVAAAVIARWEGDEVLGETASEPVDPEVLIEALGAPETQRPLR